MGGLPGLTRGEEASDGSAEKEKLRVEAEKELVSQLGKAYMVDTINQVEAATGLDLLHFGRSEQGWAEWDQERQAEKYRLEEEQQQYRQWLGQQIQQQKRQQQQDHLRPDKRAGGAEFQPRHINTTKNLASSTTQAAVPWPLTKTQHPAPSTQADCTREGLPVQSGQPSCSYYSSA